MIDGGRLASISNKHKRILPTVEDKSSSLSFFYLDHERSVQMGLETLRGLDTDTDT